MMTPERDGAANLRDYLRLLRRRWLSIVIVTTLVLGITLVYTVTSEPKYEAQAEVLVRSATVDPLGQDTGSGVNLETERQLVLSTLVAERAARRMRTDASPISLLRQVAVKVPADTQVLVIVYSASEPRLAKAGAQAFADGYLLYRKEKASEAVTAAGAALQERIQLLQEQLDRANQVLADPNSTTQEKRQATASRDFLVGELGVLRVQSATISASDISPGEIIEPARLPRSPTSPNLRLNVLGGLFLGLLLAGVVAVVRDRTAEALGGREGFERHLDRPVLGAIPNDPSWKQRSIARLASFEDPGGPVADAYRALATKILLLVQRSDIRTIAVMSPSATEGKSSVVANLAVALAETDRRVLVISADVRRPRIHQFFGVSDEVGLLNVLADEASFEEVLQPIELPKRWEEPVAAPRLEVLPSGHALNRSVRGFGSDMLEVLLKLHRDDYAVILLDSPAALVTADAVAIASVVEGVLVAADAKTTTPESVKWLREQLDQVGAHILGGVLNRDQGPEWTGYHRYFHPDAY
jgi:succinoglycan biosynthesis transport protein ExoP